MTISRRGFEAPFAPRLPSSTMTHMQRMLADYRLFFRQFRRRYHTTGAILPSGPALCRALAHYVGDTTGPNHILEVGPGTGVVTRHIVRAMGPDDRLNLVELNEQFVARLRQRFIEEPSFANVSDRAEVIHCPIEELPTEKSYDLIISGLPLNNFSVADVERILESFERLLRPGGTLSFFEYIAIRKARALVSRSQERARLSGIGRALDRRLHEGEVRRDWIWPNVPPAWVHHVRKASGK